MRARARRKQQVREYSIRLGVDNDGDPPEAVVVGYLHQGLMRRPECGHTMVKIYAFGALT